MRPVLTVAISLPVWLLFCSSGSAQPAQDFASLEQQFRQTQLGVLQKYCLGCHSTAEQQGDLDLERFHSVTDIRGDVIPWQRVVEVLDDGEMPPTEAEHQPTAAQKTALRNWVRALLDADALANAGDPGPVVLRRLNNAEFNWSVADLTKVDLQPAREFPVDSAAGEGFTNVGNALVMSPALIQKYLDAARGISAHAMLLPDRIEFSPSTTQRDWTDEKLAAIRSFYARYSESGGGTAVNLQGIQFETNGGGRLPLERYFTALLKNREALTTGTLSFSELARTSGLSQRYLERLWQTLQTPSQSRLLQPLQQLWQSATPEDAAEFVRFIAGWQQSLWQFSTIGHIGKRGGPPAWQVPLNPLQSRTSLKLAVPAADDQGLVTMYLAAADAGDGNVGDYALWQNPRFTAPGRPDLPLRDVRAAFRLLEEHRQQLRQTASACLAAIAEFAAVPADANTAPDISEIASRHNIPPTLLTAWLGYLGVAGGPVTIDGHLQQKLERIENHEFVKGWIAADALSILANSSDTPVRVPGDLAPHSVAVHPAPNRRVIVGWKSPADGLYLLQGRVQRAHMACGNGVAWILEVRRGSARRRLASGTADGPDNAPFGPFEAVRLRKGDVAALVISPRDGNHACDLTSIDLSITGPPVADQPGVKWDLAADVSGDLLAGNPHADSRGTADVWHFFSEPDSATDPASIIPPGSLLAAWLDTEDPAEKTRLAEQLQQLLNGASSPAPDTPDAQLLQQLTQLSGPLLVELWHQLPELIAAAPTPGADLPGPDPTLFGTHPAGASTAPTDLCLQAPALFEIRVPAELVAGCELVADATLHPEGSSDGSVQMQLLQERPANLSGAAAAGAKPGQGKARWSDGEAPPAFAAPILTLPDSPAQQRVLGDFNSFRELFPAALCYTRIVPVDEVVTLTLYYREDDQLRRLILSEEETRELDQLWNDLHCVSRSAFALVDAYEQLWQFATQDADPSAFTPMREGIMAGAEKFRQQLRDAEPLHLQAILDLAGRAWRRPLSDTEQQMLRGFYQQLRETELSHEDAVRMTLARVLASPQFLYRIETAAPGNSPAPVSPHELASRLSFFLWSSIPDQPLLEAANSGRLTNDDELRSQLRRMLADARIRRMAVEFGCQWLHVRDFDQLDEKSEQAFPEFAGLRGDMYEETIRFFEDLLRSDGSVLSLLDADHTFVNERLAAFYGIPGIEGAEWRKVEGVKSHARGGILAMASTLAKQSGASRTSPILRGNWVSEFLLGDRLPKPPKGVPVLPETTPAGMTERQLIEVHSSDPACSKCHARIDPFGFSLEQFDTIGRRRERDSQNQPIDAAAVLPDGTAITGLDGLRDYLLHTRRRDFLDTFCRRLLGYALGRSVQLSDEPLLNDMRLALEQNNYRISAALTRIVLSPQFRSIRGLEQQLAGE
jgi:DNA-binding IscR family transcriptional regulator